MGPNRPVRNKKQKFDIEGRKPQFTENRFQNKQGTTEDKSQGSKPERARNKYPKEKKESFTGRISNPDIRVIPGKRLGKKDMVPTGKGKITRKMLRNEAKPGRSNKFHNKLNNAPQPPVVNTRQPKVKEKRFMKPRFKDDKEFTNLFNNYKKKLMVATNEKKKW